MLKLKFLKNNQGFTLLEVLVSILITTSFVLVAMQAMALAAYVRILAKEQSDATLLIQEDLENIRNLAKSLPGSESLCTASTQTTGLADSLRDTILSSEGDTTSSTTSTSTTTSNTKILSATNKQYKLQRSITFTNEAPFNILQLNYQVIDEEPNPDRTVTEIYTEVIPDAALQC
jgi:prepilin-type N-terminal cleavage/methylation domain-containing protein